MAKKDNILVSGELPNSKTNKEVSYYAKDNFWTINFPTTASSNFLTNFWPGQNSTVIQLLKKHKKQLLGKTVLDELACGGTGLYANTGPIFNPINPAYIVGGSSSGSAWIVAQKLTPFALGHDTGDSVRRPATYCGVVGFKPSYGLISRSGVIPMASSLDTIGILGKEVKNIKEIFSIIAQKDPHDLTTYYSKMFDIVANKKAKIGLNRKKINI